MRDETLLFICLPITYNKIIMSFLLKCKTWVGCLNELLDFSWRPPRGTDVNKTNNMTWTVCSQRLMSFVPNRVLEQQVSLQRTWRKSWQLFQIHRQWAIFIHFCHHWLTTSILCLLRGLKKLTVSGSKGQG